MNPLISLVIPVYNVEKYLRKCLDSVLAQTYDNFEVILVDDGSTDASGKICDEYAQKDSRIIVYHKPNGGLSDARNFGVEHCNADLVSFIDSDDYVTEDYLWSKFESDISSANYYKKALLVSANGLEVGGVQNFLLNWISNAPKNKYEFVWYFPYGIENEEISNKFIQMGVLLHSGYHSPEYSKFKLLYTIFKDILHILNTEEIDIIHINTGSLPVTCIAMMAAKIHGVSIRIAHSHSAGSLIHKSMIKKIYYTICRFFIDCCSNKKAACSKLAAKSLFGEKYAKNAIIIPNYIDTNKFAFSKENRNTLRKQYGLDGCFVIGQVARLAPEKNQKYLLDIFNEIIKKDDTSRLLFVGDGPLENELRTYTKELGIEEYVVFVGATAEPEKFYSAMDIFVLPSLFEGLPITGIEAQASGLPCIFSDAVTQEVQLTDCCSFLSLSCSAEAWADFIIKYKDYSIDRKNSWKIIADNNYDVSSIGEMMSKLYET